MDTQLEACPTGRPDDEEAPTLGGLTPLPGETPQAFAAFTAYVSLPPSDRSIVKAIQSAGGNPAAMKRRWETWSSQHDWVARARQADAEAAAEVRQALLDQQIALAKLAGEKLLAALDLIDPADIAKRPGYVPRWIESVGSLSRLLGGLPTAITENREAANEAASAYRDFLASMEARAQQVAANGDRRVAVESQQAAAFEARRLPEGWPPPDD